MAHAILVDELVRRTGMPLTDALEKQERWAERDQELTEEERMVRHNQRMMAKWERAHRG